MCGNDLACSVRWIYTGTVSMERQDNEVRVVTNRTATRSKKKEEREICWIDIEMTGLVGWLVDWLSGWLVS